jgi:corrinoid protein of di/trimethylamine methyltransferase
LKVPEGEIFEKDKLMEAVLNGEEEATKKIVQEAMAAEMDPIEVLNKGLSKGMSIVGEKFHNFEIFLPDMLLAADAMKAGVEVLRPHIAPEEMTKSRKGTVVIGTVFGDIHDIGKNLVIAMLEAAGFEVHDIGVDVETKKFVEKAKETKADIIALSCLLTPSMFYQKDVIDRLRDMGIRDNFYIIVGGACITPEWAEEIGADGWGKYATDAVKVSKTLLEKGKEIKKPVISGQEK